MGFQEVSITSMGNMMLKICYFILMNLVSIPESTVFPKFLEYIMYKGKILMQNSLRSTMSNLYHLRSYLFVHMLYFLSLVGSALIVVSMLCI